MYVSIDSEAAWVINAHTCGRGPTMRWRRMHYTRGSGGGHAVGVRPASEARHTAVGETKQRDKEIESMKGGKEGGDGEGGRVHHPPHP